MSSEISAEQQAALKARIQAAEAKYDVRKVGPLRNPSDQQIASNLITLLSAPGQEASQMLTHLTGIELNDDERLEVNGIIQRRREIIAGYKNSLCAAANNKDVSDIEVVNIALSQTTDIDLQFFSELKASVGTETLAGIVARESQMKGTVTSHKEIDPDFYRDLADVMRAGYVQSCSGEQSPSLDGVVSK
jgi:hypothetical protein